MSTNGLSRPSSKAGRIQRALLDVLQEHEADDALPTSGRFLFYELEQRGLAVKPSPDDHRPNKRRSHGWPPGAQDITDALTDLREREIVPWAWLTDETRHLTRWLYSATVGGYLIGRLPEARINPWVSAPPMLLTESRATAGVLERVAAEYCCPIAGTAGQCGGFLRTEVGPKLITGSRVLYLGDLDRGGDDIEANTRRVLEEVADDPLDWRRLGMTEELAEERGIEPIWKVDGRDGRGHWAIEVESLGQASVVALVREALDDLLPEPLAGVLERERVERESVGEALRALLENLP